MNGKDESRRPQRRIDAAAKAAFLEGVRRGESREDAALAAGFSLMGFYNARGRDPAFKADWTEALATSAAAERRVVAYAERDARLERGEVRIACANRRLYQRRWHRTVRFTAERREVFLTHFAANCDTAAAAAQAGVDESTVSYHVRFDPAFAEAYRAALAEGYVQLEAEVLRLRLAAQKRLRAAIEAADGIAPPRQTPCPTCGHSVDEDAEFDRVMRLLARWDRKPRRAERNFKPGGQRQAWTFERAMQLLIRRLRALGHDLPKPGPGEV
jgi:hypothetical protein